VTKYSRTRVRYAVPFEAWSGPCCWALQLLEGPLRSSSCLRGTCCCASSAPEASCGEEKSSTSKSQHAFSSCICCWNASKPKDSEGRSILPDSTAAVGAGRQKTVGHSSGSGSCAQLPAKAATSSETSPQSTCGCANCKLSQVCVATCMHMERIQAEKPGGRSRLPGSGAAVGAGR
jgi:hypothetical protein